MKIGYARISTKDQNLELQIDALKKVGCELIFTEIASGAKTYRVELEKLMSQLRVGDVVVVKRDTAIQQLLKNRLGCSSNIASICFADFVMESPPKLVQRNV